MGMWSHYSLAFPPLKLLLLQLEFLVGIRLTTSAMVRKARSSGCRFLFSGCSHCDLSDCLKVQPSILDYSLWLDDLAFTYRVLADRGISASVITSMPKARKPLSRQNLPTHLEGVVVWCKALEFHSRRFLFLTVLVSSNMVLPKGWHLGQLQAIFLPCSFNDCWLPMLGVAFFVQEVA